GDGVLPVQRHRPRVPVPGAQAAPGGGDGAGQPGPPYDRGRRRPQPLHRVAAGPAPATLGDLHERPGDGAGGDAEAARSDNGELKNPAKLFARTGCAGVRLLTPPRELMNAMRWSFLVLLVAACGGGTERDAEVGREAQGAQIISCLPALGSPSL